MTSESVPQIEDNLKKPEEVKDMVDRLNSIRRVRVPTYILKDDAASYKVELASNQKEWTLWIRFELFHSFNQQMEHYVHSNDISFIFPPFPNRHFKYFTDHFDENFIENRRMLLENYLVKLLENKAIRHCPIFLQFLAPIEEYFGEENESTTKKRMS